MAVQTAGSDGKAHIIAAIIGVVGSIVVAWFTTQASFQRELSAKDEEVAALRQEVREMKAEMEELNLKI